MISDIISKKIERLKGGVAQQNLSLSQLSNLPIQIPPLPEQQSIVAILDEAFASITRVKANAEQNLKNAKELFESYLQSVFANKDEGWTNKTLADVCLIVNGGSGTTIPEYWDGDNLWITPKDMGKTLKIFM